MILPETNRHGRIIQVDTGGEDSFSEEVPAVAGGALEILFYILGGDAHFEVRGAVGGLKEAWQS